MVRFSSLSRPVARVLPLVAAALVAAGCEGPDSTSPADPSFKKGGGGGPAPKLADLTIAIAPQNAAADPVSGDWFVVVYDEASGRERAETFDCDAQPCEKTVQVAGGVKSVLAFPGEREGEFPTFLPLPPLATSWLQIADPTSAAVLTCLDAGGEIASCPAARWTFGQSFVVEVGRKPVDPVVLVPPPAVLVQIQYLDLEQFVEDDGDGNSDDSQPRSTSVVFPLCWTDAPFSGWDLPIPADGNGALPAVPLTGATANPALLPMPDYTGFPAPAGPDACPAYQALTGSASLPRFVYELDFSGTPGGQGETLIETFETDDLPSDLPGTVERFTQPLLCDASAGKATDEAEGDGTKLDFLSPIVTGFQAEVADDLELAPIGTAVAGWFSQRVIASGTSASLTIRNRSGSGGAAALTASYACTRGGGGVECTSTSEPNTNFGVPFSFEINFRPAGPDVVQASWSLVGLPFPVDGSNGNVVTFEVKAPGDAFPPASRNNTTSSDFEIPFPETCRDTNDGRWAI